MTWGTELTIEDKRRKFGRFIGLNGCETPITFRPGEEAMEEAIRARWIRSEEELMEEAADARLEEEVIRKVEWRY